MVKSTAQTVAEYLETLPPERRVVIEQVRNLILENLPPGYQESMNWGMITYCIPLERYPNTYNKQPLGYISLAAQKNYYTLYMMAAYADSDQENQIKAGFARAGKRLDMGKSCIHFRRLDDLPLDVIAQSVASVTPADFIATYERTRKK